VIPSLHREINYLSTHRESPCDKMATTMKCARFTEKGGKLEIVDVPIPQPQKGQVRIEIYACGICHTDKQTQHGYGGFPRIPGHEIAGVIDVVGEGVTEFKKGDKVGVGWFAGNHCGTCKACRKDSWISCPKVPMGVGTAVDGGYAEYVVVPADAVARIPREVDYKFAGPLCCAGVTTFNSMRSSGVVPGDLCVVSGVGGLGHMAIQFGNKMGLKVVAVSGGKDKEELAKKLGAHVYIDSSSENAVEIINNMGGADLIVATAPHSKVINDLIPALGVNGKMMVVAVPQDKLEVNVLDLLLKRGSLIAFPSGDYRDIEDTLNFAGLTGVQPMIETFPLERAQEAFDKMDSNKVRFRGVLICKKHYDQ